MSLPDFYQADLDRLSTAGRLRALRPAGGIDFSSNDYLGLAASEALRNAAREAIERGVSLGSGGSRLLRGNSEEHEALEAEAASFFGAESALFLGSGFAANSLLLATLPQSDDVILFDELVHASTHEGMRLSRAPGAAFSHNDANAAAHAILEWRKRGGRGTPWIALESLYSMDGDIAPLSDFAALAEREGAMLLIDEAHAVGVFGPRGRGLAADFQGRKNTIVLATCGKALGCEGALILAPETIRDFLINRGRSLIFSTAPSPLIAAITRASLELTAAADDRRERLRHSIATTQLVLDACGLPYSGSQIQPIIIGEDARTIAIAEELQKRGFDVRGIRPPTVPNGTSRLRISITLNADDVAIAALGDALKELL